MSAGCSVCSRKEPDEIKIWLDDQREAPDGWVRTQTAHETIELLKTGQVEEISLDHDLGPEESVGTGYDVVKWVEEQVVLNRFLAPVMHVHSANGPAGDRMRQGIASIERVRKREPHCIISVVCLILNKGIVVAK